MSLVGCLVLCETQVAVDAIGAVFRRQVGDGGLEGGHFGNQLFEEIVEKAPGRVVFVLVRLKPVAVVVRH